MRKEATPQSVMVSGSMYLVASALTFLVDLTISYLAFLVSSSMITAHLFGVIVAVAFSYFMQEAVVFRHDYSHRRGLRVMLFLLINGGVATISTVIVAAGSALIEHADVTEFFFVKVAAVSVPMGIKFFLYRFLVFRGEALSPRRGQ